MIKAASKFYFAGKCAKCAQFTHHYATCACFVYPRTHGCKNRTGNIFDTNCTSPSISPLPLHMQPTRQQAKSTSSKAAATPPNPVSASPATGAVSGKPKSAPAPKSEWMIVNFFPAVLHYAGMDTKHSYSVTANAHAQKLTFDLAEPAALLRAS